MVDENWGMIPEAVLWLPYTASHRTHTYACTSYTYIYAHILIQDHKIRKNNYALK